MKWFVHLFALKLDTVLHTVFFFKSRASSGVSLCWTLEFLMMLTGLMSEVRPDISWKTKKETQAETKSRCSECRLHSRNKDSSDINQKSNQRVSCREAFQLALAHRAQVYLICTNELRWAQVYHQCVLPVCAHILKIPLDLSPLHHRADI